MYIYINQKNIYTLNTSTRNLQCSSSTPKPLIIFDRKNLQPRDESRNPFRYRARNSLCRRPCQWSMRGAGRERRTATCVGAKNRV